MKRVSLGALGLGLAACSSSPGSSTTASSPCAEDAFAKGRDSVRCERLVDAEGRTVFLHGVNARVRGVFDVTFDDGRVALEPIPAFDASDAALARSMGFNALRLPIDWSALEPKDGGGFSSAYLDAVASVVKSAASAGLRTLVDFHQDAYSKEIGEDGAPLWAIVPPPKMLLQGPLNDLGLRRSSPQVAAAFTTFFGDSKDGDRLRARFAAAVARVAERFAGDDDVIGIEAFNEPITGTTELDRLHDAVITAVRAKDPARLVFFEPSALRNLTDSAPDATHAPWPGTVYAPHVYTFAFTSAPSMLAKTDLAPSNDAAVEEASTWKAPLAITEFGFDPASPVADMYLAMQTDLQDERFASGFFWLWKEESQGAWGLFDYDAKTSAWTPRAHVAAALGRVGVEALPGWPKKLARDRAAKTLEVDFDGEPGVTAPARLWLPADAAALTITCDGTRVGATRDSTLGTVDVPCNGAGAHVLRVAP